MEEGFDPHRVAQVRFEGDVAIGRFDRDCTAAGLRDARIVACRLGRNVRVANVGVKIAHYELGSGARVEHVGLVETQPNASFGNGVEVDVLNEGGGRSVVLFNELSAQFAYLMCVHRYRGSLAEHLAAMATAAAAAAHGSTGTIGAGSVVCGVGHMVDVQVGPHAVVDGAARLHNGTILSSDAAPTSVGAGVQAHDFIVAEGSTVDGAAMLRGTFIGQGCHIGRQFSAENSLFFANCEAFHGEAVSIFAGPYTVSHHKSTLLIAGLFSFYNAGSGTNQSNHMYKLGPVHEGKLERGSKTGSFAYMMWPCRVGPFSVVLGKHTRNVDTCDLPFSILDASPQGRCQLVPGLNLTTVGTVRDGAKWPARDRRRGDVKRDRIGFDVFSPFTVGRMLNGSALLGRLHEQTDRSVDTVNIHGADVKRVLLRKGQRFYQQAIQMYLREKIVARAEAALSCDRPLGEALATPQGAVADAPWVDLGGQLMPWQRLKDLVAAIIDGRIDGIESLDRALGQIDAAYGDDEWAWVKRTCGEVLGLDLDGASKQHLMDVADALVQVRTKFLKLVLADAQKEFGEGSRLGFGHDGEAVDVATDFESVRGTFEDNSFVKQMQQHIEELGERIARFKGALGGDHAFGAPGLAL